MLKNNKSKNMLELIPTKKEKQILKVYKLIDDNGEIINKKRLGELYYSIIRCIVIDLEKKELFKLLEQNHKNFNSISTKIEKLIAKRHKLMGRIEMLKNINTV